MKSFTTPILTFAATLLLLCAPLHTAFAATFFILPEQENFALDEEITITIKINSEGEGVNAAQASIDWDPRLLQFLEVQKDGSVFNFWADEPTLGGASSSLSFIGGSAKGISGEALHILSIRFKTQSAGVAEISMSDAAVAASDGMGTNILAHIQGAAYRIGPAPVVPVFTMPEAPKLPDAPPPPPPVVTPVVVERPAILVKNLPQKPIVSVPLYPSTTLWNNNQGEVVVFWEIPSDVSAVATVFNRSSNTVPSTADRELTTGKSFGVIPEGEWYVHVRHKNNVGWGETAHYRIAVDTTPPLPFEITLLETGFGGEEETTDNPTPTLAFHTADALSGLKEYHLRVDNAETMHVPTLGFVGSVTLPPLKPGKHRVVVKAFDQAGNSIEDDVVIDILPIPSPVFTFITDTLFIDEEVGVVVRGTAHAGTEVLLELIKEGGKGKQEVIARSITQVDEMGRWEFVFDDALRSGVYRVYAGSRDARGALSFPTLSSEVRVAAKPIMTIGPIALTKGGAALALLVILVLGVGGGILLYQKRQALLLRRVQFAESETTKIFTLIEKDAEALSATCETPGTADDEYALDRLKYNIKKMEGYLKKGIEKIKR